MVLLKSILKIRVVKKDNINFQISKSSKIWYPSALKYKIYNGTWEVHTPKKWFYRHGTLYS